MVVQFIGNAKHILSFCNTNEKREKSFYNIDRIFSFFDKNWNAMPVLWKELHFIFKSAPFYFSEQELYADRFGYRYPAKPFFRAIQPHFHA